MSRSQLIRKLKKAAGRWCLAVLCLFICGDAFSQINTSALINAWNNKRQQKNYRADTANVTLLNQVAAQYLYSKADSALFFSKQALQLAQYQHNQIGQAISLSNMAMANYVLGSYFQSLNASTQVLNISNKINYLPGVANANQITGLIFLGQNKFDDAIASFTIALNLFTQLNDQAKVARINFDIGLCYDEAATLKPVFKLNANTFPYLQKAIAIGTQIGDAHIVTMALNRTGETYFHMKNYPQAINYYQQVLRSSYHDNWETGFAYSGLAQAYYELGNYSQSILYARKSLTVANEMDSRADALRAVKVLSDSYAALKDYTEAYVYHDLYKKYNDSLMNDAKEKEINYLHLKQQQSDNLRLQREIKSNRQRIALIRLLVIVISLFAIFALVAVFIISRNNLHKTALNKELAARNIAIDEQKRELDELNHTKNQLFSVISHDLRSPFTAIMQTMDIMREGNISPEELRLISDSFYEQVTLVNNMVNNLLVWANSQQQGIKIEKVNMDLVAVADELIAVSNFLAKGKHIAIQHDSGSGEKWVFADVNHVKIILQNIIGNAIKFTPEGGRIQISYSDEGSYQAVHIKDNGVGIPAQKMDKLFKVIGKEISGYGTNNEVGAGIGLVLTRQFIEENKGKLHIKSNEGEGTEFVVYLPTQPLV